MQSIRKGRFTNGKEYTVKVKLLTEYLKADDTVSEVLARVKSRVVAGVW